MRSVWAKRLRAKLQGVRKAPFWLGLLLLGSFLIRLWKLIDQSLWFDEAMTFFWASQPVSRILHVGLTLSQDPHPPLYYLLVKPFVNLKPPEVWLRLPSVVWGTLLVGIGWRWTREHVGGFASWFVGLFLALNPVLVWYSQEARMYAQAMALLLLAWWGWSRGLRHGQGRGLATYVVAAWAAVYSYLLSTIWLPVHALTWLLDRQPTRLKRPALLGLACVILLSFPLAWKAWSHSGHTIPPHPMGGRWHAVSTLWYAWLFWKTHIPAHLARGYELLMAVLLLGLLLPARRKRVPRLWLVLALLPLLTGLGLSLRDPIVLVEPRYLLITFPALVLVWGYALHVIAERWRVLAFLLAGLILMGQVWALPANWAPENRREDWRYTAHYLAHHLGPRDAILVHPDYVRVALDVYAPPGWPVYTPFHDYVTPDSVAPPLLPLPELHDTLWLVESHSQTFDPHHLVQTWLSKRFPLVTAQYPNGIVLKGYALRYRYTDLPPAIPSFQARFTNGLDLNGCRIWDVAVKARDDRAHPPSGWVHVSLYWRKSAVEVGEVRVRVWLTNAQGVWGVQLDRETGVWNMYPPERWRPGELVRDEEDVNLNPQTPPGTYTLLVGLQTASGTPIPLDNGSPWVTCGIVRVR